MGGGGSKRFLREAAVASASELPGERDGSLDSLCGPDLLDLGALGSRSTQTDTSRRPAGSLVGSARTWHPPGEAAI
jgi:hypothetical protein